MLLLKCCFTSTETVGMEAQDIHLNFHTAPELWGPMLGEGALQIFYIT